jgi:hypothetical protein
VVYPASAFNDELFSATDLNRRAGYVLDRAKINPVTITRNEEAFALLSRDEMSKLTTANQYTKILFEIINVAYRSIQNKKIGSEHPYSWVTIFDLEELNELIIELLDTYRHATDTNDWELLKATIHEWQESAIAINSQELAEVFNEEQAEIFLTPPNPLVTS